MSSVDGAEIGPSQPLPKAERTPQVIKDWGEDIPNENPNTTLSRRKVLVGLAASALSALGAGAAARSIFSENNTTDNTAIQPQAIQLDQDTREHIPGVYGRIYEGIRDLNESKGLTQEKFHSNKVLTGDIENGFNIAGPEDDLTLLKGNLDPNSNEIIFRNSPYRNEKEDNKYYFPDNKTAEDYIDNEYEWMSVLSQMTYPYQGTPNWGGQEVDNQTGGIWFVPVAQDTEGIYRYINLDRVAINQPIFTAGFNVVTHD